MLKYAHIVGWGSYLPEKVLTNDDIALLVNTTDEWIRSRTGIHRRHIANEHETAATMGFEAAARALAIAGIHPQQVDMIIVATSTSSNSFPASASLVQDYLGAQNASAFDLSAACSGFVYGMGMATQAIATGFINTAVVIGSETMSRVLDWNDRATCILFGDGAGAVVLSGSSIPGGVMATTLGSDGSGADLLKLPMVYRNPVPTLAPSFYRNSYQANVVSMNGRQVFRFATKIIAESVLKVVAEAELTMDDVALIMPHQANTRIIETAAKRLGISPDKFYINVDDVANTSAASIPIALADAVKNGRLQPDDNVVFIGFGGGLSWGASIVKWAATPPEEDRIDNRWAKARYAAARARSRVRQIGRQVDAIRPDDDYNENS